MENTTFTIPRYIEEKPKAFGFSLQVVVISIGLLLFALIMLVKSLLISLLLLGCIYVNLKLSHIFSEKEISLIDYINQRLSKPKNVNVNEDINLLIKTK